MVQTFFTGTDQAEPDINALNDQLEQNGQKILSVVNSMAGNLADHLSTNGEKLNKVVKRMNNSLRARLQQNTVPIKAAGAAIETHLNGFLSQNEAALAGAMMNPEIADYLRSNPLPTSYQPAVPPPPPEPTPAMEKARQLSPAGLGPSYPSQDLPPGSGVGPVPSGYGTPLPPGSPTGGEGNLPVGPASGTTAQPAQAPTVVLHWTLFINCQQRVIVAVPTRPDVLAAMGFKPPDGFVEYVQRIESTNDLNAFLLTAGAAILTAQCPKVG